MTPVGTTWSSTIPGFATSKAGGGITTTMSSYAAGAFQIQAWDQTTVPPVAIDCNIHFEVKHMFPGT